MSMQPSLFSDIAPKIEEPIDPPVYGVKRIGDEPMDGAVHNVLAQCRADGNRVYLPDTQLDRALYVQVDEVFKRLLGKWKGGRTRAHIFPYDIEEMLAALVASGNMPVKNPSAYFPTPTAVITDMLEWGDIYEYQVYKRILEPSAGQGAIAARLASMFPDAQLDTCELLDVNRAALKRKGFNVVADDFLTYVPEEKYDLIVMNPPFSVDGDALAYIAHIMYAWEMLAGGGKLVAITPAGWTFSSSKVQRQFRQWVYDFGDYDWLDEDAFKESGTNVKCAVVWVDKPYDGLSWRRRPYSGFNSHHSWELQLCVENDPLQCETYNQILEKLGQGEYQADLAGMPMGEGRKVLVDLFEEVQTEHNRDNGRVFLLPEDIEFLLASAVKQAAELYGG